MFCLNLKAINLASFFKNSINILLKILELKKVLLFGAGKSATALIDYLISQAAAENWQIKIVDSNKQLIEEKIADRKNAIALSIDITNEIFRNDIIADADIVISLMPPSLHLLIAKDCLANKKSLLTASYADAEINNLSKEADSKGILFLCEMGLDPGIDHMSAMDMINKIKHRGGIITSFKSHCGGLIAPESDDNPWHYKISWNPRNVVLAGKQGAIYKYAGTQITEDYESLFDPLRTVSIDDSSLTELSYYPNRNSLPYISVYGLHEAETFIRTTLRHPEFLLGWKNIIDLKLTDEKKMYNTKGMSLQDFFKIHLEKNGFGEWMNIKLADRLNESKELLENLIKIINSEESSRMKGKELPDNFMIVDKTGNLKKLEIDELKNEAAVATANKMHEANVIMKQLLYLGIDDNETKIKSDFSSAADVLQASLESKLLLHPHDKDMVVMLHEIEFEIDHHKKYARSMLIIKGHDSVHTAMAKTVGLPLGIAAKLILQKKIGLTGVQIPIYPEIYEPVLKELQLMGISFSESEKDI